MCGNIGSCTYLPQNHHDQVLGPVLIPVMDIIRSQPSFCCLVAQNIVHVLLCHGDQRLVLQLIGQRQKPVQPVWGPLVQVRVSLPSNPAGIHDIGPEKREMAGEAVRLQLELTQQPSRRFNCTNWEGPILEGDQI